MSVSCTSAYAQGTLEAQYEITMTGVPIGHIAWHVDIGNNSYVTSANGKASGVLSVLMNGGGSVATSGRILNGQMTPTNFTSNIVDEDGKTELQLIFAAGVAEVFEDITAMTLECRFTNCSHADEPGCAIRGAIAEGTLEPARLERWRKLANEDVQNTGNAATRRARQPKGGKRK